MRKHGLVAIAVVGASVVAAPAASAQLGLPLDATYTDHFVGNNGTPGCPGDAYECGSGTAAGLGPFTDTVVFNNGTPTVTRTMVFADGSTLVLVETFVNFTPTSNAPPNSKGVLNSFGHPGNLLLGWSASGTGDFTGADGTGTDDQNQAGDQAKGFIGGTI
jgi:hypothetical protein